MRSILRTPQRPDGLRQERPTHFAKARRPAALNRPAWRGPGLPTPRQAFSRTFEPRHVIDQATTPRRWCYWVPSEAFRLDARPGTLMPEAVDTER